jgi:ATP-dependent RNA helicase RhlE
MEKKEIEIKTEKKYYDFISIAKRTMQDVYFVAQHDKNKALSMLLKSANKKQRVVICESKKSADSLCTFLKDNDIESLAIHGNHRTEQIEDARRSFTAGETSLLITTDMILKSLELKNVEQMISFDLSIDTQDYFNRIRLVDEVGSSITFVSSDDEKNFESVEYAMRCEMQEKEIEHFEPSAAPRKEKKNKKPRHSKRSPRKKEDDEE